VAREQLLAAGISRSAIGRALRAGNLHRVHRGVYAAVAPELLSEDGLLIAAVWAAGDGAILSHGTAAWRWRIIPAPPSLTQLAVPQPRRELEAVTLFRSGRMRADDVTLNGRSWTSPPATTAAPCCARSPRPSSSTTCALRTSSGRCAAATPAARTCARRYTNTPPATVRSRAGSSAASAGS
jgi:hypothetical protein